MSNEQIKQGAYEIKRKLHTGLLSYEEAIKSQELLAYERFYNKVGKEIAKKHGRTFYPFNKIKFLR